VRLLSEPAYAEEFDVVVDEITDEYVSGAFQGEERKHLEEYFFKSAARRDKLKFAFALQRARAAQRLENPGGREEAAGVILQQESKAPQPQPASEETAEAEQQPAGLRAKQSTSRAEPRSQVEQHKKLAPMQPKRSPYLAYLARAASLLIVVGVGFGVWRAFIYQSDVDKGLLALNAAYRNQRPIEARISGFKYAPLPNQRGGPANVNYVERDRAANLLLTAASERHDARAYQALGEYYLTERQFRKAVDQLKAALSLDPRNARIHSDLGAALLEEGKTYNTDKARGRGADSFADSLKHLNQALELDSSLKEALFNRAIVHTYLALIPQAEEDWKRYLQQDSKSKWADEARQNLKSLEQRHQQTSASQDEIFQDFLSAYRAQDTERIWKYVSEQQNRTGNIVVEHLIDGYLDNLAQNQQEEASQNLKRLSKVGVLSLERANDHYFQDLARYYGSIARTSPPVLRKARELMKQGHAAWGQIDAKENLKIFDQARELFATVDDFGEAKVAEYWMGFCYTRQHSQSESQALLEPLTLDCENRGYVWLEVRCLYLRSSIAFRLNQHSSAVDFALQAVALAERSQDAVGLLNVVSALIEYYRFMGNYEKSLAYIQRALPLVGSLSLDPVQGSRHYALSAVAFAAIGFYDAAADYQKEALRLAFTTKADAALSYNYAFLGMIDAKLGNFPEALKNIDLAFERAQSRPNEAANRLLMAYANLQRGNIYRQMGEHEKALESYNRAIEVYEREDYATHLFQAHKGRLFCYLAQQSDGLAREEIVTTMRLLETYRKELREENYRNTFFDVEQNVYDVAIDFFDSRMNDSYQAFAYLQSSRARSLQDLLKADASVLAKLSSDLVIQSTTQPLSLAEIRTQLPSQAEIVQYAVLEKRILIWVIANGDIKLIKSEVTQKDLNNKLVRYLQIVTSPAESDANEELRLAQDLYAILIQPVLPLLETNKQICIIGDKTLNYLPFASLVSPAGRYLIEDYTLLTAQSPTVFLLCSAEAVKKSIAGRERILSVGNPRFDHVAFPGFNDLPAASREAMEVAAFYQTRRPLIEDQATAALVKYEMQHSEVVHLALHSSLDDDVPLRSKLLMAKDSTTGNADSGSVLNAYEIYDLKLPQTRLVVLSACQTGAEHYYGGEGVASLARAFIAAGVPLVVASLWPVDSTATEQLMISFHKYRTQGLVTVEALAKAQREMVHNSDEHFRRVYYWGAFNLTGGYAQF